MKILIIGLLLSITTWAQARCIVAVGGPNLNREAQYELAMSLTKLFASDDRLDVGVIQVSSLSHAVAMESDYLVLVQRKTFGLVDVTFRNILSNRVVFSGSYRDSFLGNMEGLQQTINKIQQQMKTEGVPALGSYCFKK